MKKKNYSHNMARVNPQKFPRCWSLPARWRDIQWATKSYHCGRWCQDVVVREGLKTIKKVEPLEDGQDNIWI